MRTAAMLALAALAPLAGAQSVTIRIVPDEPHLITFGGQTTVTIIAEVHGAAAFADYWFDVEALGADAIVSDFEYLHGLGDLSAPPDPMGSGWVSVQAVNLPPRLGGTTVNPIELCRYTHTSNGPGFVDLLTTPNAATPFAGARVFIDHGDFGAVEVATTVVGARITQTPNAGAWCVAALSGLGASRRRR